MERITDRNLQARSLAGLDPSKLRAPAEGSLPSPDQAMEAARQFEAIFLKQMVKDMREGLKSLTGSSMLGSGAGAHVREGWFDSMMAERMAGTGQVGLAGRLYEDWVDAGKVAVAGEEPERATPRLEVEA